MMPMGTFRVLIEMLQFLSPWEIELVVRYLNVANPNECVMW